jgi:tetratricopeptide (TPR) repeat protein
MSSEGKGETATGGSAARMLIDQMQRERRSFWGILGVFFLLLGGIGALILYNTQRLSDVEQARAETEFRSIGQNAEALSDLRNQLNTASIERKRAEMDRIAAQIMIRASLSARNGQAPEQLLSLAQIYARKHFLGEPLNMSSGSVVASALQYSDGPVGYLLEAALSDWNGDEPRLTQNADLLIGTGDPAFAAIGHAALAGQSFRKAEPAGVNFAWDQGCEAAVTSVDAAIAAGALQQGAAFADAGDPEAGGLNLDYWRGQCLRKAGQPEKALESFDRMLTTIDKVSDQNPFKFQAFHGKGTVMTAIIDTPGVETDKRLANLETARRNLERAGELRLANGATQIGAFGSTENIAFLLLRGDPANRMVKVLEHTGAIDQQLSQTWNLVARVAAAQSLLKTGLSDAAFDGAELTDDRKAALRARYTPERLKRILFEAKAKLAQRTGPSLSAAELKKLLGPEHEWALVFAQDCIKSPEACRDLDPGKYLTGGR